MNNCILCASEFVPKPHRQKFCSRVCYTKWKSQQVLMRACSLCGRTKPNPNGKEQYWMRDKQQIENWLCLPCYAKKYLHPKNNERRMKFVSKVVTLEKNPRIGVCNFCRAIIGEIDAQTSMICRLTGMHHEYYVSGNPLKGTIEACNRCHAKITKTGDVVTDAFRKCWKCGRSNVSHTSLLWVRNTNGLWKCTNCG